MPSAAQLLLVEPVCDGSSHDYRDKLGLAVTTGFFVSSAAYLLFVEPVPTGSPLRAFRDKLMLDLLEPFAHSSHFGVFRDKSVITVTSTLSTVLCGTVFSTNQ